MGGRRRVRTGLVLLLGVTLIGALWYWLVEDFGFVDGLYQSVTTLSTVGFGEIHPLDAAGRIFTMVLIVVGVALALYTLSGIAEEMLEHQFGRLGRWRMDRRIDQLDGHVVLCGYGRVGRAVAPLVARRADVVVIDSGAEAVEAAREDGYLALRADATEDDGLVQAGIATAATIVVCLASDADAISTVLSARELNPGLRVVARANSRSSESKLGRAGVDHVVNPLSLGATRLATFAMQPSVADFMDVEQPDSPTTRFEEIVVPPGSPLAGTTLGASGLRDATGTLLVALREPGGEFETNPGPDSELRPGTTLIAMGTEEQLIALASRLGHDMRDV